MKNWEIATMQLTMGLIFVHGLLIFTKNDETDPKQFFKNEKKNWKPDLFDLLKLKKSNALKLRMLWNSPNLAIYKVILIEWATWKLPVRQPTFHIMVFGLLKSPAQFNPLSVTSYATWAHK
jgi:hypothetical protein